MDKNKHPDSKDRITSEFIKSKFTNQFDLVNHAIKLVENMIISGRSARVRIDSIGLNPTSIILAEISENKDYLEDLLDDEDEEEAAPYRYSEPPAKSEGKKSSREKS
ncbi:MAG: hypothetical protein WC222_05340 [Parachlamydiales bacterium]|jgi:hypothetical protein